VAVEQDCGIYKNFVFVFVLFFCSVSNSGYFKNKLWVGIVFAKRFSKIIIILRKYVLLKTPTDFEDNCKSFGYLLSCVAHPFSNISGFNLGSLMRSMRIRI
jgi:hypothetical protein